MKGIGRGGIFPTVSGIKPIFLPKLSFPPKKMASDGPVGEKIFHNARGFPL